MMEETVDATFLRNDPLLKNAGKLQKILHGLEETNFVLSVNKIYKLGFTAEDCTCVLVRNLIRFSLLYKDKIPLYVRIVSEFQSSNLIEQFDNQIVLIDCRRETNRMKFFQMLVDSKLIGSYTENIIRRTMVESFDEYRYNNSYEKPDERNSDEEIYYENWSDEMPRSLLDPQLPQEAIENDDIEELQQLTAQLGLDINRDYKRMQYSMIKYSAYCGSIKCFKFLYSNGASVKHVGLKKDKNDDKFTIMDFAVIGGNIEIIRILQQENIQPTSLCIQFAIQFHRIEIFDWLLEQFPESFDLEYRILCFENEFIHGIKRIEEFNPNYLSRCLVVKGITWLIKILAQNLSLSYENCINLACLNGHVDTVKFLLSLPDIDVNARYVKH